MYYNTTFGIFVELIFIYSSQDLEIFMNKNVGRSASSRHIFGNLPDFIG